MKVTLSILRIMILMLIWVISCELSIGNSSENIGTVVLDPLTGNVTYSTGTSFDFLGRNEQASETFEYTVEDSSKATAQGTVVVTVTGGVVDLSFRMMIRLFITLEIFLLLF